MAHVVTACWRSGFGTRRIPLVSERSSSRVLIPLVLAALTQAIPLATNAGVIPALQEPVSATTAVATPEQPWPPAGVFRPGGGVTAPKVTKEVRVSYTPDAMRAKVQGGVALEAVVRADRTVGEVRVIHSLDMRYGLDDEAVKALKQWQFTPGQKDGAAVPVRRPSRDEVRDRQAAVGGQPTATVRAAAGAAARLRLRHRDRPCAANQRGPRGSSGQCVGACAQSWHTPKWEEPKAIADGLAAHPAANRWTGDAPVGVQLACMRRRGRPNRRGRRRSRWASRRAHRCPRSAHRRAKH